MALDRLRGQFTGRIIFLLAALLMILASHLPAQPLDTIVFGNPTSESAHSFSNYFTVVVTNTAVSPPQTARQCTVALPTNIYGGNLTFSLAVDPMRRNYFTVKFWGGDDRSARYAQDSDQGRLYLYVPASQFIPGSTNNYQIGYRHEGDYACLNAAAYKPPLPGEFFYSTTLLPLWMTQGRTNLTLKIVSTGRIYDLGSGNQNHGGNYQFNMDVNSRSIYSAYTHTEPFLDPVGEVQGAPPATTIRPTPTVSIMRPGITGMFYNGISNYLSGRLSASISSLAPIDLLQLAKAYSISNFPLTYSNSAVVAKVIAGADYYAANYYSNPSSVDGWGGNFGDIGWAIDLLLPQLQSSLDVVNNYGAGGNVTRRKAWGDMLLASRDYGRFNRNYLSNQGLICDSSIYWANRGLLDLSNADAFSEADAERYLKEAIGLSPWLGSDLPGGGSACPHGTNYYQVTSKGLTREWGYVGQAYGEMAYYAADFYTWTTNPIFLNQCVKMVKARANFRRPSIDVSGNSDYQAMEAIGLLSWRGADESDSEFADEMAYGDRTAWTHGMRCAAVTLDPSLIGYAKQMLADNQYFNNLTINSSYYNSPDMDALDSFADYQTVASAPDSGVRLPMTDGQPDFAWADEEDGIVAVKHGGDRLWIAPYWQAKAGTGINGVARFLYITTNYAQYGVLETTPQFKSSGAYFVRTGNIDKPEQDLYVPYDHPLQAYQGERLPLGASPPLATDDGPFRGKASFYAFRFGHYLFGLNASDNSTYQLQVPTNFVSGTNLINDALVAPPVMVGPTSTVVLYLDSATNTEPVPADPLFLEAKGDSTPEVALDWSPASGATGYLVKRASVSGGPYTTIAAVSGTNYTDTSATHGIPYFYVVSGTNSYGESAYNSMEVTASGGLPSPWLDADIGTVGVVGSGRYNSGIFTISGEGSDIGSRSDSLNFGYMTMTNDGIFIAHLVNEQGGGKVGIMFRESTGANSKMAAVLIDSALGLARFPTRTSTGGNMSWIDGPVASAPAWFKLQRSGNTFTGYVSTDGTNWIGVGTNTFTMNSILLVGFAVCSRSSGTLNLSSFDNVSTPTWSPPPDAPLNLTSTPGNGQVALTWNVSANATGYNLQRALVTGGPYTTVATGSSTNYLDTDVVNGTTYYYVVIATNIAGVSANSLEASAQPESLVPPQLSLQPDGNAIQFTWPLDHRGWELQAQTNAPGIGLGTNWASISGSAGTNQLWILVDPVNGSVFYRLVYPPR